MPVVINLVSRYKIDVNFIQIQIQLLNLEKNVVYNKSCTLKTDKDVGVICIISR